MFIKWIGAAIFRSSNWVMNIHKDHHPDEVSYTEIPLYDDSGMMVGTARVPINQFGKFRR